MIIELECIVPDGTTPASGAQAIPYVQHLDGETETTKIDGTTVTLPAIPEGSDVTVRLKFYGQNKVAKALTGYAVFMTARRRATSADPVFANAGTLDGVLDTTADVEIARADTLDQNTRTLVYDVQIKSAGNLVSRVVPESHFRVEASITDTDAPVATPGPEMLLVGLPATGTHYFLSTTVKTAIYTAVAGDRVVCDASGGDFTVTLPASPDTDDMVQVVNAAASGVVTVVPTAGTIAGDASVLLDSWGSATFVYVNSQWSVL